jgi:hypothetical protein
MQVGKENPISVAFGIERNSAMDRGDLANLSAFVTVTGPASDRLCGQLAGAQKLGNGDAMGCGGGLISQHVSRKTAEFPRRRCDRRRLWA